MSYDGIDLGQLNGDLDGFGGVCPYGEMEWYCCLQAGHDGPHQSTPITPASREQTRRGSV